MDQETEFFPSLMQMITGIGFGFLLFVLSVQVVFPAIQLSLLSIIPDALSMVDFVIHEVGHLVFNFAGMFIGVLGGTLAQLFIPTVCSLLSFKRKRWVSLSCFQFWLGQSLVQISKYVGDARSQELKLFSPGSIFGGPEPIHDWHYLLSTTGLLWADQVIAAGVFFLGLCALIVSIGLMFAWGTGYKKLNTI